MPRAACLLACAVFGLLLAGCGPSGPETFPVSGTVTWNGQPLPEGTILFAPADEKGVPDVGQIVQGQYRLRAKPGKKKVQIFAERETGKIDPVMGAVPRESYIPARYNSQTTLTAEVTAGGKNEFTFDLTER